MLNERKWLWYALSLQTGLCRWVVYQIIFLPTPVWGKLPHLLCQEGLAAVAGVTPCHIAGNIVGDAQPPVIVGDQLQCLPLPWVASHHGVMVGMDNVMAELGVFGTYTHPLYMTRSPSLSHLSD